MNRDLYALAAELGARLQARQLTVTAAESCTGGGFCQALTEVAGSSQWFAGGLVSYSNAVKTRQLGVEPGLIARCGAVSEPVVLAMLDGVLAGFGADIGVAISGVAGPGGGSDDKPVGTVCIAWGDRAQRHACTCHFDGDRAGVRAAAVAKALRLAVDFMAA